MDIIFEFLPFIIAIIIFIFRLLTAKKENMPQPKENDAETSTLDDLLKQITKQINEAQKPDTTQQDKSLQEQRLDRQKEKAKKAALEEQKMQKKIAYIEKGISEEQRKQDQHFNPYKIQQASKNKFREALINKESLKNTIILKEILTPKYF
ncbi:MAG: hypothetical protein OHK0045_19350 [Raineya sp.]